MVYLESPQLDSLASAWTGRKLPGIFFYQYSLYRSVSAGREECLFRVIFFQKVEPSCD